MKKGFVASLIFILCIFSFAFADYIDGLSGMFIPIKDSSKQTQTQPQTQTQTQQPTNQGTQGQPQGGVDPTQTMPENPPEPEEKPFVDEVSYKATVKGEGEIVYYIPKDGQNIVGGKLNAGDQIEIYFEEERDDGSLLFYFITPNETAQSKWNNIKKIEKKYITAETKGLEREKYNVSRQPTRIVVMHYLGLAVYKHPAFCYEEIQHLNQGTKLKVYHLDYYRDGLWYYADEVKGYVHLTEGIIGYSSDKEFITPTTIKLYKTTECLEEDTILELEPGLQFVDLVQMDDNCYYMSAYERDGYVKTSDLAEKSNGKKSKIWYENCKMYKEGNFKSKVLYDDFPLNTEITWEYNTDMNKYGWVRATYKEQVGWFFVVNPIYIDEDSDEAASIREEYFELIRQGEELNKNASTAKSSSGETTVRPVVTPVKEEPIETAPVDIDSGENIEPVVEEPKEGLPPQTIIIISCCSTIFVLILIIVLLSKKNAWYRRRYRKGKW